MTDVILFKPQRELSAEEHLNAFIRFAQSELTTFGTDLDFNSNEWEVRSYLASLGIKDTYSGIRFLYFSHSKGGRERRLLSPISINFAKAYVRYKAATKPTSAGSFSHILRALRTLDLALVAAGVESLTKCSAAILDQAVALLRDANRHTFYNTAYALQTLARFLDENGLVIYPIGSWVCPARGTRSGSGDRSGKLFESNRTSKLPSEEVLEALPQAFRLATYPRDVIVTSVTAILCAAPQRINETLALPVDCEVEAVSPNGRKMLGLRWRGSKGAADHIIETAWVILNCAEGLLSYSILSTPAGVSTAPKPDQ